MGLLLFIRPFAFESPIVVGVKPTTKGYTLLFFCNIDIAAIRSPKHALFLAAFHGNIIPYPSIERQGFPWIRLGIFCVLLDIHAPVLYFSDKIPPVSVSGLGRRRGKVA